jgi:penicillin-binding protein 1A
VADASSFLRRLYERLRDWRRERLAWPDVRRRLIADAALARAGAARASAATAEWFARPLLPQHPTAPRWHMLLRVTTISLAALLILLLGSIVYFAFEIPIGGGTASDAAGALTVTAADGTTLAVRGTAQGEQLDYDDISPNLRKAIVAVEDRRFFSHGAVDLHGMLRALLHDVRGGHAQGASTITQQLARLMLLSNERTARRKIQEALVAVWLEHHLTKQQILARYLDTAYFGAGAYGADAAAERYFGTSARTLTLPQAAMIAGLVRAPSQLAPVKNLDGARARAGVVLHAMVETGAITKAEGDAAVAHPADLKVAPDLPPGPGYVADAAQADIKTLVGGAAQDLTAGTTIDEHLQAAAEAAIRSHLYGEGAKKHATQAALVAIGPNGAILAMVGGRDYAASPFNRATQAQRQPGSLFKLFVYLAALKGGMTPETIVDDAPLTIGTGPNAWQPTDYEGRYEGRMPLSLAFAKSVNTVAARLGQKVGIDTVIKTARDLGVASPLPNVPSLALGTANVNLMEMTRAYATVASDEETLDPYLIQRITSHGKLMFNRPPHYGEAGEPSQAKLAMRELLQDVVSEGTGRGARLAVPVGGKTGTTQDFRDAWFIGSTPDVTIGVWVGNDDNSPMDGVTGGDIPAKIWRDVALAAQAMPGHKAHRKPHVAATAPAPAATPPARAPDLGEAIGGALGDAARGVIAGLTPKGDADPDADPQGTLSGKAEVVDTATLGLGGQQVRLQGVAPMGGRAARELARYLRRREVDCTPAAGGSYRCSVDGDDLATTILSNGGAEATQDAPADLAAAQETAQEQGLGIWRGRR